MGVSRGTTNTNDRGSSHDRRARKNWLLSPAAGYGGDGQTVACYRCAVTLNRETITIDRIYPGVLGGRYTRDNIRPCCEPCNITTGNQLRAQLARDRTLTVAREDSR